MLSCEHQLMESRKNACKVTCRFDIVSFDEIISFSEITPRNDYSSDLARVGLTIPKPAPSPCSFRTPDARKPNGNSWPRHPAPRLREALPPSILAPVFSSSEISRPTASHLISPGISSPSRICLCQQNHQIIISLYCY